MGGAQKWSMSSNHVKLIMSLVVEISGAQLQGGPIRPMGAMEEWDGEEEEQTLQVKKTKEGKGGVGQQKKEKRGELEQEWRAAARRPRKRKE